MHANKTYRPLGANSIVYMYMGLFVMHAVAMGFPVVIELPIPSGKRKFPLAGK